MGHVVKKIRYAGRQLRLALVMLGCTAALLPWQGAWGALAAAQGADGQEPGWVTLGGNTHPMAQPRYDKGAVPAATPTGRLTLLLRRSASRQAELRAYLDAVQDPHSPLFHKWLTPEQYGAQFGATDGELQLAAGWLQAQGFRVEPAPPSRNFLRFAGTAGQVEKAFHTSIHTYTVGGVEHHGNAGDPQIPASLAPMVAGLGPLNDFRAAGQHSVSVRSQVERGADGRLQVGVAAGAGSASAGSAALSSRAEYIDFSKKIYYLTPADAATIYDAPNSLNRNFSGSTQGTGAGVAIGIAGYSDLAVGDYTNYRRLLLGETNVPAPTAVVDGSDPGVLDQHDGQETLLDAEITAGLAPGANLYVYSSNTDFLDDGLTDAVTRAIEDNQVAVLSMSYSQCEASLGTSGNAQWNELWQQAAAQGVSVVVAAGDTGSAACDDGAAALASQGLAVNGFASTPYDVAVGGTDFDVLGSAFTQYVGNAGSVTQANALGYIPENPWNDSMTNNPPGGYSTNNAASYGQGQGTLSVILASGGGMSSGYALPPFQTGIAVSGGAAATARMLPDVALFAGSNRRFPATWAGCSDNAVAQADYTFTDCVPGADGSFTVEGASGTAASTAAFAGVLGLVVESQSAAAGMPVRLGVANNVLYGLSAMGGSVFHDVTAGNNAVPCASGSADCGGNGFLAGYNAGPGYDLASGLGSVDVQKLIAAWPSVKFTPTATAFTVNGSTGPFVGVHGQPVAIAATVTDTDGSAVTPTGMVSMVGPQSQAGAAVSEIIQPLSGGSGSVNVANLPGGTYQVYGYYPGDVNHAASQSSPAIQVIISQEPSQLLLTLQVEDVDTSQRYGDAFPYGSYGFAYVQPEGLGGVDGLATGTVTLTGMGGAGSQTETQALNSQGRAAFPLAMVTPGTYQLSASFGGDASYGPSSTSSSTTLLVSKGPTQITISTQPSAASGSTPLLATLSTDSTGAYPTGAITATTAAGVVLNGTVVQLHTSINADAEIATFQVPAAALVTGNNTITVNYPGDVNYDASSGTAVIVAPPGSAGSPAFTVYGPQGGIMVAAPGTGSSGSVTITPTGGFTGPVSLQCMVTGASGTNLPTCTLPASVTLAQATASSVTLSINTTAPMATQVAGRDGAGGGAGRGLREILAGAGGFALASVLLWGVPSRRPRWRAMLCMLLLAGSLGMLGCGVTVGPGLRTGGTAAGTYTVTVTGTSGSLVAQTDVAVLVK